MTERLTCSSLRVRLGGGQVLDGVNFAAPAGAITAIVGPNGAGKTTLLRALAGLLAYEGSARCEGEEIASWSASQRAQRLAYVPQRSRLSARLSVVEVVMQGRFAQRPGFFAPRRNDRARAEEALERVGAAHLSSRSYPELSGGEQRLTLIARALATGARVLLLDEPTASLDIAHCLSLFERLEALSEQGQCIVCVLHDLDDAMRHAATTALLHQGRLVAQGPLADPGLREAVERTYGVRLRDAARLGFSSSP